MCVIAGLCAILVSISYKMEDVVLFNSHNKKYYRRRRVTVRSCPRSVTEGGRFMNQASFTKGRVDFQERSPFAKGDYEFREVRPFVCTTRLPLNKFW